LNSCDESLIVQLSYTPKNKWEFAVEMIIVLKELSAHFQLDNALEEVRHEYGKHGSVLIQDDVLHSLKSAPWSTIQYVDAMESLSPTDVQLLLKESTLHTSVSAWK
jgi:hypothetical protein